MSLPCHLVSPANVTMSPSAIPMQEDSLRNLPLHSPVRCKSVTPFPALFNRLEPVSVLSHPFAKIPVSAVFQNLSGQTHVKTLSDKITESVKF